MDATTTEEITAWATVGLGAVTVVLAAVGIVQARLTRKALQSADQEVREATRARIDQRAPLVTVLAEEPLAPRAAWTVQIEGPSVVWDSALSPEARIALAGWFVITNEGRSTALVEVPADVIVLHLQDSRGVLQSMVGENRPRGQQFSLPPQESRRLYVEVGQSLSEWIGSDSRAGARTLRAKIWVLDTFAEGIVDTTSLQLTGLPISQTDTKNKWRADIALSVLSVTPTVRSYQSGAS